MNTIASVNKKGCGMLSIIIPVFNEQGNLLELDSQLSSIVKTIDRPCEVIYVDDGSTDNSYETLTSIAKRNSLVKVLKLSKNFGQTLAFKVGLDYTKGDIVVFIDSDLQNDPKDIPALLDKIDEGYDIVSGWRKKRKDNFVTRVLPSIVANKIISFILDIKLHDIGCSLKAYKRRILQDVDFYGETHRIMPIYVFNHGVKITEVVVNHNYRRYGMSKYGINRTFKLLLDIISAYFTGKYSTKPMYFFGFIGLLLVLTGVLILIFSTMRAIFISGIWITPLLFISIMLLLMGCQVVLMGLLAEILMKLYYNKKPKSLYTVSKIVQDGVERQA
ncbi:MAG: glycosyltransferase family 2 protein [Planctomycetota bacterium]|jgi:glycosyltransferase involved in cell wall biosynthesis